MNETDTKTDPYSNPYATPAEQTDESGGNRTSSGLVETDAKYLFVTDPAELPERCIRTNTTDDLVRVSRQLYYVHPAAILGIVFHLPGLLILYVILRKGVRVTYSISRAERFNQRILSACSLFGFLGGVGLLIYGANLGSPVGVIAGLIVVMATLFAVIRFSNSIVVTRHNTGVFRLKGCSPAFLNSAMEGADGPYYGGRLSD